MTLGCAFGNGVRGAPHLGNRVYLSAGAEDFGPVELASGTVVGANAVAAKDTEERAAVAGVPARVISYQGSGECTV